MFPLLICWRVWFFLVEDIFINPSLSLRLLYKQMLFDGKIVEYRKPQFCWTRGFIVWYLVKSTQEFLLKVYGVPGMWSCRNTRPQQRGCGGELGGDGDRRRVDCCHLAVQWPATRTVQRGIIIIITVSSSRRDFRLYPSVATFRHKESLGVTY